MKPRKEASIPRGGSRKTLSGSRGDLSRGRIAALRDDKPGKPVIGHYHRHDFSRMTLTELLRMEKFIRMRKPAIKRKRGKKPN